jgi:hypothetical protein
MSWTDEKLRKKYGEHWNNENWHHTVEEKAVQGDVMFAFVNVYQA